MIKFSLLSSPEHEQIATQWIKWLSKEEAHYEAASDVHASFGEILLLIAIHFHGNQGEAIAELVCSVLSMNIRLGSLTRMKTLFTQEIFPEKVRIEWFCLISKVGKQSAVVLKDGNNVNLR